MKRTLNESPCRRERLEAAHRPLVAMRQPTASPTRDNLSDRFGDVRIGACHGLALTAEDKDTTSGVPE